MSNGSYDIFLTIGQLSPLIQSLITLVIDKCKASLEDDAIDHLQTQKQEGSSLKQTLRQLHVLLLSLVAKQCQLVGNPSFSVGQSCGVYLLHGSNQSRVLSRGQWGNR